MFCWYSVPACPCLLLPSVSLACVSVTEKKITPLAQFFTQDTKMMLGPLFSLPNQREGSCMMEDDSVDIENENGNRFEEYEWCGQKRIRATTLLEGGFRGKRGVVGDCWDVLGPYQCMYPLFIRKWGKEQCRKSVLDRYFVLLGLYPQKDLFEGLLASHMLEFRES